MFLLFPARSPLNMSLRRLAKAESCWFGTGRCPCALHSPQTSRCARRRVGIKQVFTARANTTPLCSFKTKQGESQACSVSAVSGGRSLAHPLARSLTRSPAASGTEYFQGGGLASFVFFYRSWKLFWEVSCNFLLMPPAAHSSVYKRERLTKNLRVGESFTFQLRHRLHSPIPDVCSFRALKALIL